MILSGDFSLFFSPSHRTIKPTRTTRSTRTQQSARSSKTAANRQKWKRVVKVATTQTHRTHRHIRDPLRVHQATTIDVDVTVGHVHARLTRIIIVAVASRRRSVDHVHRALKRANATRARVQAHTGRKSRRIIGCCPSCDENAARRRRRAMSMKVNCSG